MLPYAQANRERIAILVVKHVNDEPLDVAQLKRATLDEFDASHKASAALPSRLLPLCRTLDQRTIRTKLDRGVLPSKEDQCATFLSFC